MSLRDALTHVLARDARYSIHAYAFLFESLEYTKQQARKAPAKARKTKKPRSTPTGHVTGQELCFGLRDLALKQFGLMTITVLERWGIRSTSDVGNMVYNLIASGDFEKTPSDSRADFDHVYEFEDAFRREYVMSMDDAA